MKKKAVTHEKIKEELVKVQGKIGDSIKSYSELEWEFEVKNQCFMYIEREKKGVFDQFHTLVYELHQKTGIKNLILEKKLETIQDSLETKDAQTN